MHYGPDADDRFSDCVSDRLVNLSLLARTDRIQHAEAILDLPDDAGPNLPTMAAAWAWLWEHDRARYHRKMERAIDGATDYEVNRLLGL